MRNAGRRLSLFLVPMMVLCGFSAFALRPIHLPQTVGEQFLQGLQLRDFEYVKERIVPDQLAQFSVFQTMVDAAGWISSVRERSEFSLLNITKDGSGLFASYAIPGRGTLAVALVLSSGDWYVDLVKTRFLDAGNKLSPLGSLKISQAKPMDRARSFLEAFVHLDLVQASSYGTENTKAALLALDSMVKLISRTGSTDPADTDIKMMSEKTDGDIATVEYRIGSKPTRPLVLVRLGGNWLVDLAPGQALP